MDFLKILWEEFQEALRKVSGSSHEVLRKLSGDSSQSGSSQKTLSQEPLKKQSEDFQETLRRLLSSDSQETLRKLSGSSPGSSPGCSTGSSPGISPGSSQEALQEALRTSPGSSQEALQEALKRLSEAMNAHEAPDCLVSNLLMPLCIGMQKLRLFFNFTKRF